MSEKKKCLFYYPPTTRQLEYFIHIISYYDNIRTNLSVTVLCKQLNRIREKICICQFSIHTAYYITLRVDNLAFYRIKTACNLFSEIALLREDGLKTFYLNPVV